MTPLGAADGVLDPTFGSPGTGVRVLAYDLGGTHTDRCGDVAARGDGVLAVGGTSTSILGDYDATISWLASNGSTLAFRTLYWDLPGGSLADAVGAVAFDRAGRTLAALTAAASDRTELRVCRMNATNFLNDAGWNGGTCVSFDLGAGTYLSARRIVETPDGGVLVAGTLTQPWSCCGLSDENWYVLKLTSTGALDGGFGFFGVRVLPWNLLSRGTDRLTDLAVEPSSGAIFLVGSVETSGYMGFLGLTAKLSASGNLDLSWGSGGLVALSLRDGGFVLTSSAQALAIDPLTGIIWVALQATSPTGVQLGITAVTPEAGLSDPVEFAWAPGTVSAIARLLWQDDGRLLVAGSSADGTLFEVSRFLPFAPTFADLDPSYGIGGTATFDADNLGWGIGQELCGAALSGGRVVIAGDSDRGDIDQLVARFSRGPLFSDDFELFATGRWSATSP